MQLHTLEKTNKRSSKRLGQGHGSGRGKTSGRGTKGQNARGKVSLSFEGGIVPLIKRLPFRRGKGKNKSFSKRPVVVNLGLLNVYEKNGTVSVETLVAKKIVTYSEVRKNGVKILGDGFLEVPLTIGVPISKRAAEKVKKAGGTIAEKV